MKYIIYFTLSMCLHASTVRIMTYNLLNYEDEDSRENDYISIVNYIEPDLIVAQEVIGQSGYDHFISDVLNVFEPGAWSSAPFTNQSAQQDIVLYYHHDVFSFVSTSIINTASSSGLRDVVEFIMVHESSGIEFRIYGVHLKASSGSSNASERLAEVTILRDYLNELDENSHFMVVGDFNIYSNSSDSEPAFDMLTGEADDNDGRLFDPIDRIGHWHNNSSYADVHTQSPRTTSFGGGATGGMDDRFDWIFSSLTVLDQESDMHYVEDTYSAVGNDGNHFNDAINNGNNSSVNDAMADALHDASDHLPVYMDVWFDDLVYNDAGIVITEIMPNPASVSDSYGEWFEIHNTTDSTINIDGWTIKDADNDDHIITNDSMYVPVTPGEYFVFTRNDDFSLNGGIISNYEFSGVALSNSEDEIILLDHEGSIVDEVHYTSSWAFGSGESMEIHNLNVDNNVSENWYEATLAYGNGDLGTPGTDYDGTTVAIGFETPVPDKFKLFPPYPNPFNPTTTINFQLEFPISGNKTFLLIYDIKGRLVEMMDQGLLKPGSYDYKWNAQNQPSGVYFIRLVQSGKHSQIQKVVLLK